MQLNCENKFALVRENILRKSSDYDVRDKKGSFLYK